MKQILVKSWAITLVLLIGFVFTANLFAKINADSNRVVKLDEAVVKDISGGVKISSQHMKTIGNGKQNGITDTDWNPHTIHWADFNPNSEVKVVTYSGSNADKWKNLTTRKAAAEWEKENPGWIVLAGINGDFFDINGTGQPTGNFMQSGDMYRAQKAGEINRQTIGWNADGSVIIGDPTISSNMYVKVYEDGFSSSIENELVIENVNKNPKENGINLYTNHASSTFDLSGYTVYDCVYTINRQASGGGVFVKGTVTDIKDGSSSMAPGDDHFYLATKDSSLEGVLNINDALKCEQSYTDKWSNVQNSIGYIHQVLANGAPIPEHAGSKDAFINTNHPRTLIGFRADGTTVFMAVEGRGTLAEQKIGVSLYEAGEILADLGCVTGFNLDGGGSTTLIARNAFGGFDVVNDPSDGSERSDGNHCLVVMRDPGFKLDDSKSTYDKAVIDLNVYNQEYFANVSDIKVTINGVTKSYEGSPIAFENVDMDSSYEAVVTYTGLSAYGDKKVASSIVGKVSVPEYDYPEHGLSISKVGSTSITISRDDSVPAASMIKNVVAYINGDEYKLGNELSMVCDGLKKSTTYEIYFTYEIHETSGKVIPGKTDSLDFTTLSFEAPSVVQFVESMKTSSALAFKYEYKDPDAVLERAYISYGDNIQEVKVKSGTATITGLDFENNTYEFKLVLEYKNTSGRIEVVESEVLTYAQTGTGNNNNGGGGMASCAMGGAYLVTTLLTLTSLVAFVFRKRK